MKTTVTERQFIDAFDQANRSENFSKDARRAMFKYFEELEESCGQDIEFDVIGICCEWSEYESIEEFRKDYGEEYKTMRDIQDVTQVIEFDGGFVIQQF